MKKMLIIPLLVAVGYLGNIGVQEVLRQRNEESTRRIYKYRTYWVCDNCSKTHRVGGDHGDMCMWCAEGKFEEFLARRTYIDKPWAADEWGWEIKYKGETKVIWIDVNHIPSRALPPNGPWE